MIIYLLLRDVVEPELAGKLEKAGIESGEHFVEAFLKLGPAILAERSGATFNDIVASAGKIHRTYPSIPLDQYKEF